MIVLRRIRPLFEYPLALFFVGVLICAAIYVRINRLVRPRRKPRILWGSTPISGTQYYSQACHHYGYQSHTLMYGHYFMNKAEDFDLYPHTLFPRLSKFLPFLLIYKYLCFIWALPKYEVYFHTFDGGLLVGTPLKFLEIHFWHLAGAKIVVYPYGSDVQIVSRIPSLLFKHTLITDYPQAAQNEEMVKRRIQHFTKHANYIFTSIESVDYLPYWDLLLMQNSAIDTTIINPDLMQPGELRQSYPDKKIIFHAPNHPHIKGTNLLIEACEELKREGRDDFELVLYQRKPNDVILQAIYDADIVADQFIIGTYAMFAIEAMALGKPVMCYLRPDLYQLFYHYSWGKVCPLVNTSPDRIKETIVQLLDHPEERERLGQAGRCFVKQYHSLEAMGRVYDSIIRKVWNSRSA